MDLVIDCAADPGMAMAFVEAAEVSADRARMKMMDIRRLAGDKAHNIPAFLT